MSICHPEINRFQTVATRWGCDHEKNALSQYSGASSINHEHFHVEECGLFISTEYPFIGASPDGLVTCTCCGDGICEFKCPYCHKDDDIQKAVDDINFCLEENEGTFSLKHDHSYFYQVQCQLFCTNRCYCDFVLWSEKEVDIERMYPDESFWLLNVTQVRRFFVASILPELMGKFYSRTLDPSEAPCCSGTSNPLLETETDGGVPIEQMYCYCQKSDEHGDMVGCDNPTCPYQWFHLSCLNLVTQPRSKCWYCPDCCKLPEFRRKKAKIVKV